MVPAIVNSRFMQTSRLPKNLNVGGCESIRDSLGALPRKHKIIDYGAFRRLAQRVDPLTTVPYDSRLCGSVQLAGIRPAQCDLFGFWHRPRFRPLKNDLSHFLRAGPGKSTDRQGSVLLERAEQLADFGRQLL